MPFYRLIIPGIPPAMLGRLPEFDNSGRKRKPPSSEPPKAHVKEAFNIGFTQSVALDLGPHDITVNAVCSRAVATELHKKV